MSNPEQIVRWIDDVATLDATLVFDDTTLGPGCGGMRTYNYRDQADAEADARRLARAMSLKNSLAGLPAGGAKLVIRDRPGLDRSAVFSELGHRIQALGGRFWTAGDLGTEIADLEVAAAHCDYVLTDETQLAHAVGVGLVASMRACAQFARGHDSLSGLRVLVQGCGAVGSASARLLAARGVEVILTDINTERLDSLARELDAETCAPENAVELDCDILSPCAVGGVITPENLNRLNAWAICGAANNILSSASVASGLSARGVCFVPDFVASAGASIDGLARTLMGVTDHSVISAMLQGMGATTLQVLELATAEKITSLEAAEWLAVQRIEAARRR